MNDIERFALNVEYTTGKKRGRHPVFSSSQFYPYAAERRLQNSLRNELERYMAEAFGAATAGENFVTDTLEDLSRLPDEISEDMKNEIAYASDAIARKVSSSIAEMTEMTIGKPYYPPAAKQEILTSWEANFQTLCKSAKSDMKKEMSMIVQQAKNEGWNGKQLEREIRNRLPEKYAGRAKNIARTETGKLNTAITLSTYKEIGIQYYVWMATMDERTRPDHAMMNGLICSATDPTVWYEENPDDPMHPIEHKRDDTMVHLHPGEDFQCRCTMVMWDPVVDGKYEVKERQPEEEPEEGQQGAEKATASQELEKATEALAEKEKALEKAENERKTVERELAKEKKAKETAEAAKKEAEAKAAAEARKAEILQKANERHAARTEVSKQAIQDRWDNRKDERAGLIPKVVYDEKIEKAKTAKELIDYIEQKRGFKIEGFAKSDLATTKEILSGIDSVMEVFNARIGKIGKTRKDCLMSATLFYDEKIPFEISVNNQAFISSYTQSAYHPGNFSAKTSAIHEMGHIVNYYLAKLEKGSRMAYEYDAIAKEIVEEAANNVDNKFFKKMDLIYKRLSISEYADKRNKFTETIAEAFSDVWGNRKNASPMSKQIYKAISKRVKDAESKHP